MKKLFCIFSILIVLVACSEQEMDEVIENASSTMCEQNTIRSYDEAFQAAQSSLSLLEPKCSTRGDEPRKISLSDNKVYRTETKTRAGQNIIDTLFYVFNFEDNKGFVVISASKNTEAVLAVAESGNYDPYVAKGIEGFDYYMDVAKDYVQQAIKSQSVRSPGYEFKDSLISITHQQEGPLLTVKWGQTYPEGEYCPNGIAGCTNTALAQVMSYYSYPDTISITYPSADVTCQSLNWTAMRAHQTGHDIAQCSSLEIEVHKSIGRLLRQLGYLNGSSYYSYGTGTSSEPYARYTMQYLNYYTGSSFTSFDWSTITNSLENNRLLLIKGYNSDSGHCWVIDGYTQTTYTYQRYILGLFFEFPDEWSPAGLVYHYNRFCHFNWGWYGNCDGYFSSDVFNTQAASSYDTGNHTANYDFSSNVTILPVWR